MNGGCGDGMEVEGVYLGFPAGAALILFARKWASYLDREPRTLRLLGIYFLAVAIAYAFYDFGPAAGGRALAVIAPLTAPYIWSDVCAERAEARSEIEKSEAHRRDDD